jgi:hypothetical protein
LSLSFRKANDEQLKKSLAEKLKQSKMQAHELSLTQRELLGRLEQVQRDRDSIGQDLMQAKDQVRRVTDAMTIENQKQLNELREKMLLEQAEMQVRFDREIKDSRQKHEN